MPRPHSHMKKEGGAWRGLRTIIIEGISITNSTKKKKPHPSFPLERMCGVIIIISGCSLSFSRSCITIGEQRRAVMLLVVVFPYCHDVRRKTTKKWQWAAQLLIDIFHTCKAREEDENGTTTMPLSSSSQQRKKKDKEKRRRRKELTFKLTLQFLMLSRSCRHHDCPWGTVSSHPWNPRTGFFGWCTDGCWLHSGQRTGLPLLRLSRCVLVAFGFTCLPLSNLFLSL
jgi:hypothetical protein